MTAPVVKGILDGLRPDDFGITVSVLLGCPRKVRLMQEWPYYLKPSESWWVYRGQLMHGVAYEFARRDENAIAETRFSMLVDTANGGMIKISGQPDLVFTDRSHLLDFKTTKRTPRPWLTFTCPETGQVIREGQWAPRGRVIACPHCELGEHPKKEVKEEGPPRAYSRHVRQISLYRLLLAENGIEVSSGEIVYQDMSEQVRIPINLIPIPEARALLESLVAMHTQGPLPRILTNSEEVWECDWCMSRGKCEELHGGLVGKAALEKEETREEPYQ
jgi:CRISPR/Cas system-associated exonuclease Cas4 (RecB family)